MLVLTMTGLGMTGSAAGSVEPDRAGALIRFGTVDRFLSPNGDGRHDFARVTFVLGARAHVRALVRNEQGDTVHDESLGTLEASRHVWRWAGGGDEPTALPDGSYTIVLRARTGQRWQRVRARTKILTEPDAGRLLISRPVVYPYATAVADRLQAVYVRADYLDEEAEFPQYFDGPLALTTRFVVRAPGGERVFERFRRGYRPWVSWSARDGDGQPLPPGTYHLRVSVTDPAGNVRLIRRPVEVSSAQLEEHTWSATLAAAAAATGPHPTVDPGCNGCLEVCPPVPSDRYPNGLSFLQPCDFGYASVRWFGAGPPFAPAPVDSFRVSATGGPPVPGGSGVGYLDEIAMGPGDTTVSTPWRQVDLVHHPYVPDGTQPMSWAFSTSQGNDYDVATFTLDYRYYAPVE
jgi:hypothetical protein